MLPAGHMRKPRRGAIGRRRRGPGRYCLLVPVTGAILLLFLVSRAEVDIGDILEVDGIVDIGLWARNDGVFSTRSRYRIWGVEGAEIAEAEVDIAVAPVERIEARFDIHGEIGEPWVELQKAYVQFSYPPAGRVRIGRQKKDFGLEDRASSDELYTVDRSHLHQYLESFLILGRDMTLDLRWTRKDATDHRMDVRGAAGADGDLRVFLVAGLELQSRWGTLVATDMFVIHETSNFNTSYNLGTAGLIRERPPWHSNYELMVGKDPNASEMSLQLGAERNVMFAALRSVHARTFLFGKRLIKGLEPVLGLVYLTPDLRFPARARGQVVPGLNVLFEPEGKVRWMTNVEVLLALNAPGSSTIDLQSSVLTTQVQVSW